MKTSVISSLTVHPQAAHFRSQNRHLQSEIARLIVERDDLKFSILPNIEAEYRLKIGAFEWRVFQMNCEMRAMLRRIEMAQAMLNRGDEPCFRCIETEIETEFAVWREQIEQKSREIKAAKVRENLPVLSRRESRELQTLYRKLAFLLHPDIAGNSDERRQKLWLQTSEAYRNSDLQTLRTIRFLIGNVTEAEVSNSENQSILEILQIRCAELKQTCEKFLDEIYEIKSSAPYLWHEILDDAAQLEKIQANLREKIEIQREKRRQLTTHWAEIMRFAKDREIVEMPVEPPDIFAVAEDDWAEIIYEC